MCCDELSEVDRADLQPLDGRDVGESHVLRTLHCERESLAKMDPTPGA